jgi:hypothetical protein
MSVPAVLACKLAQLEKRIEGRDAEIAAIFEAIRQMMEPPEKRSKRIGFHASLHLARESKGSRCDE